jgi:hypothetical protein
VKKWCKDRKNKWNKQKNSSIAGLFENKEARIVTILLRGRGRGKVKDYAKRIKNYNLKSGIYPITSWRIN